MQGLLALLAPDVTLVADGGGIRTAALRPILGADKVVRYLVGLLGKTEGTVSVESATVNGGPALVVALDGEVDGVVAARVEAGRIAGLYYVRNPEKLARLDAATALVLR